MTKVFSINLTHVTISLLATCVLLTVLLFPAGKSHAATHEHLYQQVQELQRTIDNLKAALSNRRSAVTVDLKVNGSDGPAELNFADVFEVTWSAARADHCIPVGDPWELAESTDANWADLEQLEAEGSMMLRARISADKDKDKGRGVIALTCYMKNERIGNTDDIDIFINPNLSITLLDSSATVVPRESNGDYGVFELEFEVGALTDDVFIPADAERGLDQKDRIHYGIMNGSGETVLTGVATPALSSTADEDFGYYVIQQGDSESIVISVTFSPSVSDEYRMYLMGIGYNDIESTPDSWKAVESNEFMTSAVKLTSWADSLTGSPGSGTEPGVRGAATITNKGIFGQIQELQTLIEELRARLNLPHLGKGLNTRFEENTSDSLELIPSSSNPDAATIVVDPDDGTLAEIFVFALSAEESETPIQIQDIELVVEISDDSIDEYVNDFTLQIGGSEFIAGAYDGSTTGATIHFDIDGAVELEPGTSAEAILVADFKGVTIGTHLSLTIQASVGPAGISAEGVDDLQVLGETVVGEHHTLMNEGLIVDLVGRSSDTSGDAGQIGIFSIEFDVTAVSEDFYIPKSAGRGEVEGHGITYNIYEIGEVATEGDVSATLSTTAEEPISGLFRIAEGETETFTLTVMYEPVEMDMFYMALNSVNYSDEENTDFKHIHAVDRETFRTGEEFIMGGVVLGLSTNSVERKVEGILEQTEKILVTLNSKLTATGEVR